MTAYLHKQYGSLFAQTRWQLFAHQYGSLFAQPILQPICSHNMAAYMHNQYGSLFAQTIWQLSSTDNMAA